jgi:tRNA(adenine34) deaminase
MNDSKFFWSTLNRLHLFVFLLGILPSLGWSPPWNRQKIVLFDKNEDPALIHKHFMTLALEEAKLAARRGEVPIGAILVQNNQLLMPPNILRRRHHHHNILVYQILAQAGNRVECDWDASAHAELQVLRGASRRLQNWRLGTNTTLYSTLEPCPMCLAACQAFRISTLVYGAPDLRLGAVETHIRLLDVKHPYHNISNVISGVMSNESSVLLRSFFQKRRQNTPNGIPQQRWMLPIRRFQKRHF